MPPHEFRILHEDAHLVYVDKPPKILATPVPDAPEKGPSLFERMAEDRPGLEAVHRLDYETSGVICFAKDKETAEALVKIFRMRQVKKVYQALVHGWVEPPQGEIDLPIRDMGAEATISHRGDPALTRYSTIGRVGPCTHLRVEIETGRHNQIRLHFAHKGHPLIGERKYARGSAAKIRHNRVLLHSYQLSFQPPHLDHVLRITSPLPADFEKVVAECSAIKTRTAPSKIPPLKEAEGMRPTHRPFGTKSNHGANRSSGRTKKSAGSARRGRGRSG